MISRIKTFLETLSDVSASAARLDFEEDEFGVQKLGTHAVLTANDVAMLLKVGVVVADPMSRAAAVVKDCCSLRPQAICYQTPLTSKYNYRTHLNAELIAATALNSYKPRKPAPLST